MHYIFIAYGGEAQEKKKKTLFKRGRGGFWESFETGTTTVSEG